MLREFAMIKCVRMRIMRIEHVQLAMPVGGEAMARGFYGDLLGIPETPKPPNLAKRGGCWFECDDLKVHLGVEADFRPARKAHVALQVDGLAALRRKLSESGITVKDDEPLEGYERLYVDDPFGNRLELMELKRAQATPLT
jgi:catechol 2,3-dioxygenase-like lactoylglutathione lyase family enzyme